MSDEVCRLCSKSDNALLCVFANEKDEKPLAAKIFDCFGVEVKEDDPISKRICKSCYFFTNSAYEYRISALQNDDKLKQVYEKSLIQADSISYPHVIISQDDFLNTFNLANKNNINDKPKELNQYHLSVQRLKRKYPEIHIPPACNRMNVDPVVSLDASAINQWNDELQNLDIWTVNGKKLASDIGVTLTRIKRVKSVEDIIETSDSNSERSPSSKKKRRKNVLWCEPRSKSFKFCPRKGGKKNASKPSANVTAHKENKTVKVPEYNWESETAKKVSPKPIDNNEALLPRVTRRTAKAAEVTEKLVQKNTEYEEKSTKSLDRHKNENSDEETLGDIINKSLHKINADENPKDESNLEILSEQNVMKHTGGLEQTMPEEMSDQTYFEQTLSKLPAYEDDGTWAGNEDNNLLFAVHEEMELWICQTCNKVFDTQGLLNKHKKSSHTLSSLHCSHCSKKFSVVESLMEHLRTSHSELKNSAKSRTKSRISPSAISETCPTVRENPVKQVRERSVIKVLPENNASNLRPIERLIIGLSQPRSSQINPLVDSVSSSAEMQTDTNEPNCLFQSPSPIFELLDKPSSTPDIDSTHSDLNSVLVDKNIASQNCLTNSDTLQESEIPNSIAPIQRNLNQEKGKRRSLIRTEIAEYVISSDDDDIEITDVALKIPIWSVKDPFNKGTAMQPHAEQASDVTLNITTEADIAQDDSSCPPVQKGSQSKTSKEPGKESMQTIEGSSKEKGVTLRKDQVLLIVESDPEDDAVIFVPNEESVLPNVKSPKVGPSSNSTKNADKSDAIHTVEDINRAASSKTPGPDNLQRIIMVPNPEDKREMNNLSKPDAKMINENRYIDYIFNKCRFEGKYPINGQKWILKDLRQVLDKNYIPVEIGVSNINEVSTSYVVPPAPSKPPNTAGYWNYQDAIGLPKPLPTNTIEKQVIQGPSNQSTAVTELRAIRKKSDIILSVPPNSTLSIPANANVSIAHNRKLSLKTNNNVPPSRNMSPLPYTSQPETYGNGQAMIPNAMLKTILDSATRSVKQNHLVNLPPANSNQVNLLYILKNPNTSADNQVALNPNSGAPKVNETNTIVYGPNVLDQAPPSLTNSTQHKPTLLNGMSYRNFSKYHYGSSTSEYYLPQIIQPQPNINIQNYFALNQTNIATSSTNVQEQFINAPMVGPPSGGETNENSSSSLTLESIMSMSNGSVPKSSETVVKPSIRLKNISELTGKPATSTEERNILHGYYSNTITNYVNSTTTSTSNNAANSFSGNSNNMGKDLPNS